MGLGRNSILRPLNLLIEQPCQWINFIEHSLHITVFAYTLLDMTVFNQRIAILVENL